MGFQSDLKFTGTVYDLEYVLFFPWLERSWKRNCLRDGTAERNIARLFDCSACNTAVNLCSEKKIAGENGVEDFSQSTKI